MKTSHFRAHRASHFALTFVGGVLFLTGCTTQSRADTTLWRIGKADNSLQEFGGGKAPEAYAIPADWSSRAAFSEWPGISHGDWENSTELKTNISFSLDQVPQNGTKFSLKTLNASQYAPQLAVFSNGTLCGIIQMMGSSGFKHDAKAKNAFGDLYQIYIPKETLQKGENILRLVKLSHPYGKGRAYLSFSTDFLQLEALSAPATEPIHSRLVHLCVQGSAGGGFNINQNSLDHDPKLLKWIGAAYSSNMQRATFWRDVAEKQPMRREYLEMLRDLNMAVLADNINALREEELENGEIPEKIKAGMAKFIEQYGSLFQAYELNNEPTMGFSNGSLTGTKKVAEYLKNILPTHVQLVAPGYAYGGGHGTPKDWDGDAKLRAEVEALCDATNGHAYADSYRAAKGGNFIETLKTYGGGPFREGFPKPFINSEFGAAGWMEEKQDDLPMTEPRAALFDRIMRAHIGFADASIHYNFFPNEVNDHNLLQGKSSDPTKWTMRLNKKGVETSRLDITRQLILAYATHGAPLSYTVQNAPEVANKLVLFRPVDTSKLAPLPGSGAKSNKILLNFINFEATPQSLQVRVEMPEKATYKGERIGPGATLAEAFSPVSLEAAPTLELKVELGPRQSVQYILEKSN